jgi:hypothetical protein
VVRDPLDTLLSVFQTKNDDAGLIWNTDMENILLEYGAYLTEMAHWRKVLPNRMIELSYERLVLSPETVVADLLENSLYLAMESGVRALFRYGSLLVYRWLVGRNVYFACVFVLLCWV